MAKEIDRLLLALSDLQFKNDTDSIPAKDTNLSRAIDKANKSRLVFDLTEIERMRIVSELVNCEFKKKVTGYGIVKLASYNDLMDDSKGYVRDDVIYLQAHLKAETIQPSMP